MPEYRSLLYQPIFDCWGVPAQLVMRDGTVYAALTAIDMTTGEGIPGASDLETVMPNALMLYGDLADAGVPVDEMDDAMLTINTVVWRVTGVRPLPSPNGVADGEVQLFLERAAVG